MTKPPSVARVTASLAIIVVGMAFVFGAIPPLVAIVAYVLIFSGLAVSVLRSRK